MEGFLFLVNHELISSKEQITLLFIFIFQEQPPFDKKQFITYMKRYIKLLTAKLEGEQQELFKKHIEGATKSLLSKLKDLQLYVLYLLWIYIVYCLVVSFMHKWFLIVINVTVLWGRVCTMMEALSLLTTRKVLLIQLLSTLPMDWRKSSAEHMQCRPRSYLIWAEKLCP